MTMLYAIVGIPLTLLTITNLGGFMATAFRWFYKNVVCGVCFCTHCCGRSTAKRRKAAAHAAAAAVEATKTIGREVARNRTKRTGMGEPANLTVAAPSTGAATSTSDCSISRESSVSTGIQVPRFHACFKQQPQYTAVKKKFPRLNSL